MSLPRKIVFVIPALSGGGAERVLIHILRHIDRNRFQPYLVVFRKKGAFVDLIPPDVAIQPLVKSKYYFFTRWLIYFNYKKYIAKLRPDMVLSFMWYPNFIVLLEKWFGRCPHKVTVSERTTLSFTYEGRIMSWFRSWGIRLLYPKAAYIITPSKQIRRELLERAVLRSDRVKVIPNPIDSEEIEEKSRKVDNLILPDTSKPLILSIGRLTIQKGYKYLINAFAQITESHPSHLMIIGDGKERALLDRLINQLNIKKWVHLPGFQKNPYNYLSCSTIFVLSSIFEGFPNVLIEAMALGVPCIATRCPAGPNEIITDGVDGVLVPPANEEALAHAMKTLLNDEALRKRLGEAGRKRIDSFRVEKIVRHYENVLESA